MHFLKILILSLFTAIISDTVIASDDPQPGAPSSRLVSYTESLLGNEESMRDSVLAMEEQQYQALIASFNKHNDDNEGLPLLDF